MRDVAVALLLDSSAALYNEWAVLLTRYVSAMLGRIHNSEYTFSISIVTYSAADYRPSPIVAKRYFNVLPQVLKEIKDEPMKLGIGMTGNAGRYGTAALEGYASVIEMFDLFIRDYASSRETPPDKAEKAEKADAEVQSPLCHIIHLCATQPDDAKRPMWNTNTTLDSLTWASLPEELTKRNINLNLILLRPNKILSDLHSNAADSPLVKPFFPVQNGHVVLLSSESSWTQLSNKRQIENAQANKAPDAKRTRTQTPSVPEGTTQNLPVAPPASSSQIAPPSTVPGQMSFNSFHPEIKRLADSHREHVLKYQTGQQMIQSLLAQNRTAEVEVLKQKTVSYALEIQKIKVRMMQIRQIMAQQHLASAGRAQPVPPVGDASQGPSNETITQLQQLQLIQQARNQTQQLNSTTNTASNTQIMPIDPNVAAQMQKLQMKEGIQGLQNQAHAGLQQQSLRPPMFGGINPTQPNTQPTGPMPVPHQQISSWMGILAYSTPQPVEIQVLLSCDRQNLRPELWPPKIDLQFSRQNALDTQTLKSWIQRHSPAVCRVKLIPRMPDAASEEQQFRTLLRAMQERTAYAFASWLNPRTGSNKPMLCLFATSPDEAVAAVFPETGVPELPSKASSTNAPFGVSNTQQPPPPSAGPTRPIIPPALQQQLARLIQQLPPNLTPEEKKAIIGAKFPGLFGHAPVSQAKPANAATVNNGSANALQLNQGFALQQNNPQSGSNAFNSFGNLSGMGGAGPDQGGGGGSFLSSDASIGGLAPQQWNAANAPTNAGPGAGGGMPNLNTNPGAPNGVNFAQLLAAMQQQQQRQQQQQQQQSQGGTGQQNFMR